MTLQERRKDSAAFFLAIEHDLIHFSSASLIIIFMAGRKAKKAKKGHRKGFIISPQGLIEKWLRSGENGVFVLLLWHPHEPITLGGNGKSMQKIHVSFYHVLFSLYILGATAIVVHCRSQSISRKKSLESFSCDKQRCYAFRPFPKTI